MPRIGKQWSKSELTDFRKRVKILKDAGMIDVNVSKAMPYMVRSVGPLGGKLTLYESVKKYDDVISQKAAFILKDKLSFEEAKRLKREGYEQTRTGFLYPHSATEKVRTIKGKVVREDIKGVRHKDSGIDLRKTEGLRQYLYDLRYSKIRKEPGTAYAFRYFGGHSKRYGNLDLLIDDFEKYISVVTAIDNKDARAQQEIIRNFEIVTTTTTAWQRSKDLSAIERTKRRQKAKPHQHAKRMARMRANSPFQYAQFKEVQAKRRKKDRAKMTPAQREAYKAKARARAQRWRDRRKGL